MTPEDIPQLQAALQAQYPAQAVRVDDLGRQLRAVFGRGGARRGVRTPETMDYRALDWREWLDRIGRVIGEKTQ